LSRFGFQGPPYSFAGHRTWKIVVCVVVVVVVEELYAALSMDLSHARIQNPPKHTLAMLTKALAQLIGKPKTHRQ